VIPVNLTAIEILGKKSYAAVSDAPDSIDIVRIFRPADEVSAVVKDALDKDGIRVIWMSEGVYNAEGEPIAKEDGIEGSTTGA
jgi:predicted CoA-binding protein